MSWGTVGTLVGAVVGSVVPGLGTAAGAAIGGAIGGQIDLAQVPTSRLDDLSATKVNFSAPISKAFGHPRLGGNIVWCSNAIANGKVGGSKGGDGGGQEVYIRHLIVKLDEEQNGFPARWWMGGKMVYNLLATASDETIDATVEESPIRELIYHNGSPTQLPFPIYASIVGEENAIAYRGHGTAFLTVDCGTSGQLPPMTYELAGKDAGDNSGRTYLVKENWAEADVRGDPPEGSSVGGLEVIGLTGDGVQTYRLNDNTGTDTIPEGVPFSQPGQGNGDTALAVWGVPDGVCKLAWAGSGYSIRIDCEEPNDFLGASQLRFCTFGGEIAIASSLAYETGLDLYSGCLGTQGNLYIHRLDGSHVHTLPFYPEVSKADSVAINATTVWILDGASVYEYEREYYFLTDAITVPAGSNHRIFISYEGALCIANSDAQVFRWEVTSEPEGEDPVKEWVLVATLNDALFEDETPVPAEYLGTDNAHHMVRRGSVYAVVDKINVVPEDPIVWPFFVNPGWSGGTIHPDYGFNSLDEIAHKFAYIDGSAFLGSPVGWAFSFEWAGGTLRRASRFDGWEITNVRPYPEGDPDFQPMTEYSLRFHASRQYGYPGDSPPFGMQPAAFDVTVIQATAVITDESPYHYVDVYRKRVDVDVYDLTEPTLQEVVEALCIRAGLEEEAIDATELATKDVHAFSVTQVGPTSSAIELLMAAYRFYCVETQGALHFRFLGASSVRTIPYEDLGAAFGEPPANPLSMIKGNELELPSMQSVRYSNISDDYQDGLESSDRLLASIQSAQTSEYAIGLYPDEAKQLAAILQQVSIAGIIRIGPFTLGPEHRDIEAGDVITIVMRDGGTIQCLITRTRYDRGVIEAEGASYDAAAYVSDATTANDYEPAVTVRRPPDTEALIFDPPLLTDDSDGPSFRIIAKPERYPWSGYSFLRSPDDNTYTELYQSSSAGVFGTCSTTLAAWTGGRVVDWKSTVTVNVGSGELSSITRSELLTSRLNLAMVGDELLQFKTAELVTTGVYILSEFVRYIGGTEWVTHASGEDFILIEPSSISRVAVNLADEGVSRFYKAVTRGRNVSTADAMSFAPDLVSLKPIAPANPRAIVLPNQDILLRWVRRTRYETNIMRGIVPLGESTEAYTIDVYDGSALLRTINTTTTDATYTAAQQAADGVESSVIRFEIRQVGSVEGYPAELEI